ncbi:MAG: PKD domain-containing protein, partial [Candidatus Thermoplasmatota archaeon]|nr:PKD domain-containing protein [Candidatus Thermoplasmatota archaeon]
DGWEDIYIPQVYGDLSYTTPHLYRNKGYSTDPSIPDGTTFEDVTDDLGIKGANTYACLWVDYDNDGDLDLVTGGADRWDGSNWQDYRLRLYQNQGTGSNHWLKVKLNGTEMNPDGIGARIVLRYNMSTEPKMIIRELRAGTGHAHQEGFVLHLGLGDAPLSDSFYFHRLEVHWSDGLIQYIDDIDLNSLLVIDRKGDFEPAISSWGFKGPASEDRPLEVFISPLPQGPVITGYEWDMDMDNHFDAITSGPNITMVYHEEGLKHVRCRVLGEAGLARDIYPIEVIVPNDPPVIDITDRSIMMDTEFALSEDTLTDTPSDLVNLTWDVEWGDGSRTTGRGMMNGSHTYRVPGVFTMKVTAGDGSVTVIGKARIEVLNVDPMGWVEPLKGNGTLHYEDELVRLKPIVFDTPSDTGQKTMRWDFGDGNIQETWSDLDDIIHRYTDAGNYSVTAYVRDQYGGTGSLSGWVNVANKAPLLHWVEGDPGLLIVDEDSALDLDDIIIGEDTPSDLPELEYNWDFGDGSESGWRTDPDIGHIYRSKGTYELTCTVRDDDGEKHNLSLQVDVRNVAPWIDEVSQLFEVYEDEMVELVVKAKDTPSDRDNLVYELRFEDDHTLTSINGTFRFSFPHKGYYEMIVVVMDDDLDSDSETVYLTVKNILPGGKLCTGRNSYEEDEEVLFEAVDLLDTSGDIQLLEVTWDFDDDSAPVVGLQAVHTYTRKGRYTVKMTIDDGNDRVFLEKDIVIENPVPVALMNASHIMADVGVEITFDAVNSSDNPSDVDSLLFLWDFDDGRDGEGVVVKHSYDAPGTYNVVLEVMDDDGASSFAEMTIEISDTGPVNGNKEEDGSDIFLLVLLLVVGALLILICLVVAAVIVLRKRQEASQYAQPVQAAGVPPMYQTLESASHPGGLPGQWSGPPSPPLLPRAPPTGGSEGPQAPPPPPQTP